MCWIMDCFSFRPGRVLEQLRMDRAKGGDHFKTT
ncbi:msr8678 [Mesorhizobium japonicum MAFF 303099]|uniref:Msr8678 protein n=1 Tax=Mesorhizobium japonicum (strain LMG 29417 / CECT 9101 / MAFF 303099) TaxID=266835 RepID=Q98AT1_RHILO|nr:msr8678 [Mesorhizobium japonicum MAFF 303099]